MWEVALKVPKLMPLESTISAKSDGMVELRLEGSNYLPHWIVGLFAALSRQRVSIVSGQATQGVPGEWKSCFVLDFSKSSADPGQLNYVVFAEQTLHTSGETAAPRLTRFELLRRADQLLELKLEGPDQVGFLASILSRVSLLALFPSRLEIDTRQGQIKDVIVLRGIGDKGPGEAAYKHLERMLKSFLIKELG